MPAIPREEEKQMATRQERLTEFSESIPPEGKPVQLLCEDHCGTYLIPYDCERRDGAWYRIGISEPIDANVIGWRRAASESQRSLMARALGTRATRLE